MKKTLQQKGIKVVEFAKLLGISPSQASLYVHGWTKIPEKYHKRIEEILQIKITK